MSATGYKLGGNAQLLYSSATQRATWPTSGGSVSGLMTVRHVGDLKAGFEKGEDDATTRDTPGFEASFATLIKADISFTLKKDNGDAAYQAFRNNFFSTSGACIAVAVMDGDPTVSGTEGLWADMQVFKFEQGQPVKGMQTVDVTLKPALNTAAGTNALGPQYVVVGTGPIIG